MINYDKIRECRVKMAMNADGGFRLSVFAVNELLGKQQYITEEAIREGFDFAKAKQEKEIEESDFTTNEEKEVEKKQRELFLKLLEEQVKLYLKSQHRLL
ncbi:MAG: hypothetical protein BHV81_04775 [Butyricimonas synergistica]|nr:MAG: hypothetical protein BHV81_04775 [Butyricimonas synergistica]